MQASTAENLIEHRVVSATRSAQVWANWHAFPDHTKRSWCATSRIDKRTTLNSVRHQLKRFVGNECSRNLAYGMEQQSKGYANGFAGIVSKDDARYRVTGHLCNKWPWWIADGRNRVRSSGGESYMSMQVECAHEILEASFDGACTDEQRIEFARIVDDHPELFESLIEESLIHSLLLWDCERASPDIATLDPIVASQTNESENSPY